VADRLTDGQTELRWPKRAR